MGAPDQASCEFDKTIDLHQPSLTPQDQSMDATEQSSTSQDQFEGHGSDLAFSFQSEDGFLPTTSGSNLDSDIIMMGLDGLSAELLPSDNLMSCWGAYLTAGSVEDLDLSHDMEYDRHLCSKESDPLLCQTLDFSRPCDPDIDWHLGQSLEGSDGSAERSCCEGGIWQDRLQLTELGTLSNNCGADVTPAQSTNTTISENSLTSVENSILNSAWGDNTPVLPSGTTVIADGTESVLKEKAVVDRVTSTKCQRKNDKQKSKFTFPELFPPRPVENTDNGKTVSRGITSRSRESDNTHLPTEPPKVLQTPFKLHQFENKIFISPFDEKGERLSKDDVPTPSDESVDHVAKILALQKDFETQSKMMMEQFNRIKQHGGSGKLKTQQGEFYCNHNFLRGKTVRQMLKDVGADQGTNEYELKLPVGKPSHKRRKALANNHGANSLIKRRKRELKESAIEGQPEVECLKIPHTEGREQTASQVRHEQVAARCVERTEDVVESSAVPLIATRNRNYTNSTDNPRAQQVDQNRDKHNTITVSIDENTEMATGVPDVVELKLPCKQHDLKSGVLHHQLKQNSNERAEGVQGMQKQCCGPSAQIIALSDQPQKRHGQVQVCTGSVSDQHQDKQEKVKYQDRIEDVLCEGHPKQSIQFEHERLNTVAECESEVCYTVHEEKQETKKVCHDEEEEVAKNTATENTENTQEFIDVENSNMHTTNSNRREQDMAEIMHMDETPGGDRLEHVQTTSAAKKSESDGQAQNKNVRKIKFCGVEGSDVQINTNSITEPSEDEPCHQEQDSNRCKVTQNTTENGSFLQRSYDQHSLVLSTEEREPLVIDQDNSRQNQTETSEKEQPDLMKDSKRKRQNQTKTCTEDELSSERSVNDRLKRAGCQTESAQNSTETGTHDICKRQPCHCGKVQTVASGSQSRMCDPLTDKELTDNGDSPNKPGRRDKEMDKINEELAESDPCSSNESSVTCVSTTNSSYRKELWSQQNVCDEESTVVCLSDSGDDVQEGDNVDTEQNGELFSNTSSELIVDQLPVVEKQGKFLNADAIFDGDLGSLYHAPFILVIHQSVPAVSPSASSKLDMCGLDTPVGQSVVKVLQNRPPETAARKTSSANSENHSCISEFTRDCPENENSSMNQQVTIPAVSSLASMCTNSSCDDINKLGCNTVLSGGSNISNLVEDFCDGMDLSDRVLTYSRSSDWLGCNPSSLKNPSAAIHTLSAFGICSEGESASYVTRNNSDSLSPPPGCVTANHNHNRTPSSLQTTDQVKLGKDTIQTSSSGDSVPQRNLKQIEYTQDHESSLFRLMDLLEEGGSSTTAGCVPAEEFCSVDSFAETKRTDSNENCEVVTAAEDLLSDSFARASTNEDTVLVSGVLPDLVGETVSAGVCSKDFSPLTTTGMMSDCACSFLPDLLADMTDESTGSTFCANYNNMEHVISFEQTVLGKRNSTVSPDIYCEDAPDVFSKQISLDNQDKDYCMFEPDSDFDHLTTDSPFMNPASLDDFNGSNQLSFGFQNRSKKDVFTATEDKLPDDNEAFETSCGHVKSLRDIEQKDNCLEDKQHQNSVPLTEETFIFEDLESLNQNFNVQMESEAKRKHELFCGAYAVNMDPLEVWVENACGSVSQGTDMQETEKPHKTSLTDETPNYKEVLGDCAHCSNGGEQQTFTEISVVSSDAPLVKAKTEGPLAPKSSTESGVNFTDSLNVSGNTLERSKANVLCPQNMSSSDPCIDMLFQTLGQQVTSVNIAQANDIDNQPAQNPWLSCTTLSGLFQSSADSQKSFCSTVDVPSSYQTISLNDLTSTRAKGQPSPMTCLSSSFKAHLEFESLASVNKQNITVKQSDCPSKLRVHACPGQDFGFLSSSLSDSLQACDFSGISLANSGPSLSLTSFTQSSPCEVLAGTVVSDDIWPVMKDESSGSSSIDSAITDDAMNTFKVPVSIATELSPSVALSVPMSFSQSVVQCSAGLSSMASSAAPVSLVSSISSENNISADSTLSDKSSTPCTESSMGTKELSGYHSFKALSLVSETIQPLLTTSLLSSQQETVSAKRLILPVSLREFSSENPLVLGSGSSKAQTAMPIIVSSEITADTSNTKSINSDLHNSSMNSDCTSSVVGTKTACSINNPGMSLSGALDGSFCGTVESIQSECTLQTSVPHSDVDTFTMTDVIAPSFPSNIEDSMDLQSHDARLEVPTVVCRQQSSEVPWTVHSPMTPVAVENTSIQRPTFTTSSSCNSQRPTDCLAGSKLTSTVSSQQLPPTLPGPILASEISKWPSSQILKSLSSGSTRALQVSVAPGCPLPVSQSPRKPVVVIFHPLGISKPLSHCALPSQSSSGDCSALVEVSQADTHPGSLSAHVVHVRVPTSSATSEKSGSLCHELALKLSSPGLADLTTSTMKYLVAPVPDKRYQPCPCHPLNVETGQETPGPYCIPFNPALLNCQAMKVMPAVAACPQDLPQNPRCIGDGVYEYRPSAADIHMAQTLYSKYHHKPTARADSTFGSRPRFYIHGISVGDFTFTVTEDEFSRHSKLGFSVKERLLWYKLRLHQPVTAAEGDPTDHQVITVEIHFSTISRLWGEDNKLLVELNKPPVSYLGKLWTRKPSTAWDISRGQLAQVPYHFLIFQDKCVRSIKRHLCQDSRFCHLLIQPVTVDLSRRFSPDSAPQPPSPGGGCMCKKACQSWSCRCRRSQRACGRQCKCWDCQNPFSTLRKLGLSIAEVCADPCFADSLTKIKDLKQFLARGVRLGCCGTETTFLQCVPNVQHCSKCSAPLRLSWCLGEVFTESHRPHHHCIKCRKCCELPTVHCDVCGHCTGRDEEGRCAACLVNN